MITGATTERLPSPSTKFEGGVAVPGGEDAAELAVERVANEVGHAVDNVAERRCPTGICT